VFVKFYLIILFSVVRLISVRKIELQLNQLFADGLDL